MKSVCAFLLAVSGASAFAPAQTARTTFSLAATAEDLAGLRGCGPETGGKVVSCSCSAGATDGLIDRCRGRACQV